MNRRPAVTVFIPVFNAEAYIKLAIDSILCQSFEDFELLIIDDGSTDNSSDIIRSYTDDRIRFIVNESNKGVSYTRNRALKEMKGDFLALLDADDVALPHRLERQFNYLLENPDVVACGSAAKLIDKFGKETGEELKYPFTKTEIKVRLVFNNILINSSMMYRANAIRQTKGYYNGLCEDYELTIQLNRFHEFANLSQTLIKYRLHDSNTSTVFSDKMQTGEKYVIGEIHKQLGIVYNERLIAIHHDLSTGRGESHTIEDFESLLLILQKANRIHDIYPKYAFERLLLSVLYRKIRSIGNKTAAKIFFSTSLLNWRYISLKMVFKMTKQLFN